MAKLFSVIRQPSLARKWNRSSLLITLNAAPMLEELMQVDGILAIDELSKNRFRIKIPTR